MFEKVNPSHPDKLADRIAGAIVDLAYTKQVAPRIAVEVLLGHGQANIIIESSVLFEETEIGRTVDRTQTTVISDDKPDYDKMTKAELVAELKRITDDATSVIDCQKPSRSSLHPTMKPIALFSRQINNSSKSGENVLDIFGGSGTTIMACEEMNRHAFCCELDEHYCDVIVKRWEDEIGKKAYKEESNG